MKGLHKYNWCKITIFLLRFLKRTVIFEMYHKKAKKNVAKIFYDQIEQKLNVGMVSYMHTGNNVQILMAPCNTL